MADIAHKFETAGLGRAPFRFVNYYQSKYQACPDAPVQPGTVCDFCWTGIIDVFVIRDADGKEFKVGSTCVDKTGDAGLVNVVKRKANQLKREKKNAKDWERIKAAKAIFTTDEALRDRLAKKPHPRGIKEFTLLDYIGWCFDQAGLSGRLYVSKIIENEVSNG
jgi:hypothetical protein